MLDRGKDHGKRDACRYVCSHAVCKQCGETVWKIWIGNEAGLRYAMPVIKEAATQHRCNPST